MSISRRTLLQRAAAFGLTVPTLPLLSACSDNSPPRDSEVPSLDAGRTKGSSNHGGDGGDGEDDLPEYDYDGPLGPESMFSHGVASGDPLVDSVILWTRLSPADDEPLEVFLEVALDPNFENKVAAGWFETDSSRDYTVKVETDGLDGGNTYYYRFHALGRVSPVGRTRTAPSGMAEHLRFAVCSCSNFAYGYFHAYAAIGAREDLDAVIHLGDYIYEYATGDFGAARPCEPEHELVSLSDYRTRYAQYRSDLDLQEAHRQHPFITVWDDHESANNAWKDGAKNHNEGEEGPWADRLSAARKAYDEWMPIREGVFGLLYRRLPFGDLVDVLMLDTRITGRDRQDRAGISDPNRTLLGFEQEAWLEDQLAASTARWRILGQQVMMAQLGLTPYEVRNPDQWDGYHAARLRLYRFIRDQGIDNIVVLTGDIHSSWANDLVEDPWDTGQYDPETGSGALGVEFVTPAISSPGSNLPADIVTSANPHIKWVELTQRGYMVLDVNAERVQADWFHYSAESIESSDSGASAETEGGSWFVRSGEPRIQRADRTTPGKTIAPALAPATDTGRKVARQRA